MNVTIRLRGVSSSPELVSFVRECSASAFSHFGVRDVHVTLEDVNGPKGGRDKQCRLRVRFRSAEVVLVCLGFSEFAVVEDALEQLREQVVRLRERRRAWRTAVLSPVEAW
jgi:putative sigma-54 modulation protein